MFTRIKAFESPFTDVGNLYYLCWFIAVGAAATILGWALRRSLTDERPPQP